MRPCRLPCLLLLLLVGAVSAQPPTDDGEDAAPARAEAPEQPEQPSERVNSGGPLNDGSLPPDDYEASEQISEDLSVSFPVDI